MRFGLTWLLVLSSICVEAQFDLGFSGGAAALSMWARKSEGHSYSKFSDVRPALYATVHFRRRRPKTTNFCLELQFTRREFSIKAAEGSLAGSSGIDVAVKLYSAYANAIWDVSADSSSNVNFRFGLQLGMVVGGSMTGRIWNSYPYHWSSTEYSNAFPSPFGPDLRGYLGLGFEFPFRDDHRMTMDPFFSFSITSMVSEGQGARCMEIGFKLGWAVHHKALSAR